MKLKKRLLVMFFGVLLLANPAHAESPREQLTQMVGQLQRNPGDNALREKIIKLAQELNPAPAIPEEAERHMARGKAAKEGAKSALDYQDAVKEFELATLAAPWYGDAYFNLGVMQDKAEDYASALRSLKLAQLASPEDKEIKALIYEVEYRGDKARSAIAVVEQKKKTEKEFFEKLEGSQWEGDGDINNNGKLCTDSFLEIHRGKVYSGWVMTRLSSPCSYRGEIYLGRSYYNYYATLEGRYYIIKDDRGYLKGTISEDGEKIVVNFFPNPSDFAYDGGKPRISTYHRVKNPKWTIMNGDGNKK